MNSRLPEPESLATSVVFHWAPPAGQIRRGVRGGKAGRVSGGGAALVPAGSLRRRGARLRINEPLTPLWPQATLGLPHKTKLLTPFLPRQEWGYRIKLHNPFATLYKSNLTATMLRQLTALCQRCGAL